MLFAIVPLSNMLGVGPEVSNNMGKCKITTVCNREMNTARDVM